jgi:ATP-binding cassette subfamily C (CFTR/MRP) protein 1
VATIRAYRREAYFTAASDALMELNAAAFVSQRAASAWLAVRLDLLGVVVITLTAVLSISGGITPALAGLCLVYALDMTVRGRALRSAALVHRSHTHTQPHARTHTHARVARTCQQRFLKYGTAMAAKTESDFNSVERVVQYLTPDTEAPDDTPAHVAARLPRDWPAAGAISVQQLALRYRPGLPLVLRGVSCEVAGGHKVGLVGRTGSGKSSLLLALFRCARRRCWLPGCACVRVCVRVRVRVCVCVCVCESAEVQRRAHVFVPVFKATCRRAGSSPAQCTTPLPPNTHTHAHTHTHTHTPQ